MNPSEVLHNCLIEAGNDIEAGFLAAEYILSNELDTIPLIPQKKEPDTEWVTVPDSFLSLNYRSAALAVETRPPDIIVHVAAPIINIPKQAAPEIRFEPVINVAAPLQPTIEINVPKQDAPTINIEAPKIPDIVVNVPKQSPPTINVAAPTVNVQSPVVNVAAPNVTVESPAPQVNDRKVSLKKDGLGNWVGEVTGGGT